MVIMHADPPALHHVTTPMNKIIFHIFILMGTIYEYHINRSKMLLIRLFRGHLVWMNNIEHVESFYIFSTPVPRIAVWIKFAMFCSTCKRVNSIYWGVFGIISRCKG